MDSAASNGVVEGSIVKVEHSPAGMDVSSLMRRATDVAGVCREIVMKTARAIGGSPKKHLQVEGWQSIAAAYGCTTGSRDVEEVYRDGKLIGFKAIGEVRRASDGVLLAQAEGFVGMDEPKWAKGPEYAMRSMTQTRSISRTCRGVFAFVVTMIDSGLSTTPYEEMDGINAGSETPPAPVGTAGIKAALRQPPPSPPKATEPPHDAQTGQVITHDRSFVMPFANKEKQPIRDLSEKSLRWFKNALTENVNNPDKARFRDEAMRQLNFIEAEMAFRGI